MQSKLRISDRLRAWVHCYFFVFMMLHRMELCLVLHRPDTEHTLRKLIRMEGQLFTATLFLDKTIGQEIPDWITWSCRTFSGKRKKNTP